MKAKHILLLIVCFQALFSQAQIRETKLEETTFYFIRHAEKTDPPLMIETQD